MTRLPLHLCLSPYRNFWKCSALLFSLMITEWMRPLYSLMAPITVMEGPLSLIMLSFMPGVSQHFANFIYRCTVVSSR